MVSFIYIWLLKILGFIIIWGLIEFIYLWVLLYIYEYQVKWVLIDWYNFVLIDVLSVEEFEEVWY